MELDYKMLGDRIVRRRKSMGMKQKMLAEQLCISNNYLSGIEHGREKCNLELLVRICNILKVTPDYLLLGNLHPRQVPQNIIDGLQLCSQEDIALLSGIIQMMIGRQNQKWNEDNFV